jgi:hypothetical protein
MLQADRHPLNPAAQDMLALPFSPDIQLLRCASQAKSDPNFPKKAGKPASGLPVPRLQEI